MKRYDEIKINIQEAGEGPYTPNGGQGSSFAGHSPDSIHQIEKPGIVEKINGFIKAYTNKEYIDVNNAIVELRQRLNTVGFDFEYTRKSMSEGISEYTLTQFGGRYGWDMDKGDIVSDDGITHRLGHGLVIRCESYQTDNGLWKINASIVPVNTEGVEEGVEVDIAKEKEAMEKSKDNIKKITDKKKKDDDRKRRAAEAEAATK
ncbi:MAG: hypothetical protein H8D80_00165 [Proteobacteria bacterium]|nr:hypothetical protein [Pseudomonadota bacterium]